MSRCALHTGDKGNGLQRTFLKAGIKEEVHRKVGQLCLERGESNLSRVNHFYKTIAISVLPQWKKAQPSKIFCNYSIFLKMKPKENFTIL